MAGLATATMVPSSATIITPRATVTRVRVGLPRRRRGLLADSRAAALAAVGLTAVFMSMRWSLPGARVREPSRSGVSCLTLTTVRS